MFFFLRFVCCRARLRGMIEQTAELRRSGIGASDAAAVCGLSRYRTPVEVYLEKIGELEPEPENDAMHFGKVLEAVVADEFALRNKTKLRRVNRTLRHKALPWMMCHADRMIVNGVGLECKTAGRWYKSEDWGPDGSDEVPIEYLLQCQHCMAVTGQPAWFLAVLLAGNEYRQYYLQRSEEIIESLVAKESVFWRRVETRDAPAPTNPFDASLLHPRDRGASVLASFDASAAVLELRNIGREKKALEAREKELKTQVMAEMKDALILQGLDGQTLATWKTQARAGYTVAPSESRVFRLGKE